MRKFLLLSSYLIVLTSLWSQDTVYFCDFDHPSDTVGWRFVNGAQPNYWTLGNASNMSSGGLYVTNDGSTNAYGESSSSVAYVCRSVVLPRGAYRFSYNWRCMGECSYGMMTDYLRLLLVPDSLATRIRPGIPIASGSSTSSDMLSLDGGTGLVGAATWQTFVGGESALREGVYWLVLMWHNDSYVGNTQPPAAVDNLLIESPRCPLPAWFYADSVSATAFTLHWSDLGRGSGPGAVSNTTQWLVELDSATQAYGQGTVYSVSDTLVRFTGLAPNTEYRAYIRAVCGPNNDTLDTVSLQVRTGCGMLTSLPYVEDFESVSGRDLPSCWMQLVDGGNANVYVMSGSLRWNPQGEPYQYVVLPAMDATAIPIDSVQLSLWASSRGDGANFEVGVMTDPADIATFEPVGRVDVVSRDWTRYVVDFSNSSFANHHSSATSPDSPVYIALRPVYHPFGYRYGNTYFDDFVIDYATCQPVAHLAVGRVGTTGARVDWSLCDGHVPEPDSYEVCVERVGLPDTGSAPTEPPDSCARLTTVEPHYLPTGLAPSTTYRVWVRVRCADDSNSVWDSVRFTTLWLPCVELDTASSDTVPLGTDSSHVTGVPVSYLFANSMCQSVYTADELHAAGVEAGPIAGLDYTFTTSDHDMQFSIYVSTTDRSSFPNRYYMDTVHGQDLRYGPSLHPAGTAGRVYCAFDSPFEWDGESNLVVTTVMNNGTSTVQSSLFYGNSTQTAENRTLCGYLNDQPYDSDNMMAGNNSTSRYRPSVDFHTAQCGRVAECAPPAVVVDRVGMVDAYIEWIPGSGEQGWRVLYRQTGVAAGSDTGWTVADTHVDTNHYHLINLEPGSNYEVRVVPRCDSAFGTGSLFAQAAFTTECALVGTLPWMADFEDFEAQSYIRERGSCWYGGGEFYPRIVSTFAHGGQHSLSLSNNSTLGQSYVVIPPMDVDVSQLQLNLYAYADSSLSDYRYRLVVGVMDDPADITTFQPVATVVPVVPDVWEEKEIPLDGYTGEGRYIALVAAGMHSWVMVDDLMVDYIPLCQRPRTVTVDRVTRTTAVVQWDGRGVRNYVVEYGPSGFEPGTGSVVATVLDSVTLTGLSHSTVYDVYVRGICDPQPGEALYDTSAYSFVTTFATLCGEIESLPYIQNFASVSTNGGSYPHCWVCGGYTGYPYVVDVADIGGHPCGHALYMPAANSVRTYAILPAVDTMRYPVTSLQVLVEAHSVDYNSYYSHDLVVGLCQTEGDIVSFTPVDTIELTIEPTVYVVPLADAVGLGCYIAFVSTVTGGHYYNTIFLDSVVVMPIPSCQVPYGLSATSLSPTTADLLWQSRGGASEWQVEYMPHGIPMGAGTRLIANSTTLTLAGLTPATDYDFYVRSICDTTYPGSSSHPSQEGTDTSGWCYAPGQFTTQQIPAMVPYFYACDSATEWDNWQTLANGSVGWYRGMADGHPAPGIYLSADSGSTRSIHEYEVLTAVAYRDIDFGTSDTSFVLSFSASVGGNQYYDGMAVFLADPAVPPASLRGNTGQTPWGQRDTLPLLAHIRNAMTWTDYSVTLDSIHGIHRLVFFAYGEGTYSNSSAAVDNISIQYAPCQRPYSLRAVGVTAVSATVLWHGSATADYHVRLYDTDGALLFDDTVHTNSIQYLSLIPSTTYKVRVGRLCDGSEILQPDLYTFSTPACMDGYIDTVGNLAASTSATDVPLYINYPYSYTQQIIRASELLGRGEITAINFLYDAPYRVTLKTNCTIYLGHTTMSDFSATSGFVPPADLEPVYIGPLNCSQGWNRILLGSPFAYDGTSNLVIAVDDNSGSQHYSGYHFATSATADPLALSFYGYDNVDCSSSSALSLYAGGKAVRFYRSLISLEICPPNGCQPPRLLTPRVRANDVTLCWRGNGQSQDLPQRYLFGYRRADSDRWIVDNLPTTDTFYTVDRFVYGDDYVYHVRQYCDNTSVSNWAIGSFNTAMIPCLPPEGLQVVDATNQSVHLAWTPADNHIGYHLHVWGGGIDTTLTTYIANATVDGLNPASRYYASVEVQCEYVSEPSGWSDTITFETPVCPDVTGLIALDVQGNSVLLDWDDNEETESWLIEWGLQGFDQGTGVLVDADHHPFLLTGLTGETTYDIVVRAVCGDDYYSEAWSPRLTLTTAYSGIDQDELSTLNSQFSIFPNPTTGDVTLTLPASVGTVRVEVVDMAGRQCLKVDSHTPPLSEKHSLDVSLPSRTYPGSSSHPSQEGTADASNTQAIKQSNNQAITTTLPTRTLPAGAYYVRLTGDRFSAVRKLLKIEN